MRSFFATLLVPLFVVALLVQASPGGTQTPTQDDPAGVAHAFIHCLNTADTDALLELFAPGATLFGPFADSPARIEGEEQIRSLFEPLFSQLRESGEGPTYMNLNPLDVQVQRMGDTAVVSFHLGAVPDQPLDRPYSFSRRTLVLRRSEDRWRITHLHASNILIPPASEND